MTPRADPSFGEMLAACAEEERAQQRQQVTFGDLVSYAAGTLGEPASEQVEALLAVDPQAADLVLEARRQASVEDLSKKDVAVAWQGLEARLEGAHRRSFFARYNAPVALAAVLTIALLSVAVLRGRPSASNASHVSGLVHDHALEAEAPAAAVRGATVVEWAADVDRLSLRLRWPKPGDRREAPPPVARYELLFGERMVASGPIRGQADGTFVLHLATVRLASGRYRIQLLPEDVSQTRSLAIYTFELQRQR